MIHCLSDEALLECHMGEGGVDAQAHLKTCARCADRYRALQRDMAMIGKTLEMPAPRRRRFALFAFPGWRPAAAALALTAAFLVGWSLRASISPPSGAQMARQETAQPAAAPVQLSMANVSGVTPVAYANFVQDAFQGDLCTQPDDLLEPGCL